MRAASSPIGPAPVTSTWFGRDTERAEILSTCSHALATTDAGSVSTPSSPRLPSTRTANCIGTVHCCEP